MSVPCVILSAIVDKYNPADMQERVTLTTTITMLVGFLCLFAGLFRLGALINFLSQPVLKGFVTASAITVIV
eukprot:SAG31_NODE_8931_length_1362_cov_0.746635_3_plen_71_part_01